MRPGGQLFIKTLKTFDELGKFHDRYKLETWSKEKKKEYRELDWYVSSKKLNLQ